MKNFLATVGACTIGYLLIKLNTAIVNYRVGVELEDYRNDRRSHTTPD